MYPCIPLRSKHFSNRIAIVDTHNEYTYEQLWNDAYKLALFIINHQNYKFQSPIMFIITPCYDYVVAQWAIWLAGCIAVPVHIAYPKEEIKYIQNDTGASLFIHDDVYHCIAKEVASDTSINLVNVKINQGFQNIDTHLPKVNTQEDAMIIYTSGTTGKPKGVVFSHRQIEAQVQSLTEAWAWTADDYIINVLPLHHVHGVINILCCALYNGACCEMLTKFDAGVIRESIISNKPTLFMAVPTIYHKLISYFSSLSNIEKETWHASMKKMRLMISGSAALPVVVLERWEIISGHTLLERYGMTEIGMALSNSYTDTRYPGCVGKPLPGVSVRIVDEQYNEINTPDTAGQLEVCGNTVFKRYWQRPEATIQAFDGTWFKTGDWVSKDANGIYKILGRMSSDIIKYGGYKVSALEIENILLENEQIQECAVVALPDDEWGEIIAAAIICRNEISVEGIQKELQSKLVKYKIPTRWLVVKELPRNALGKVLKKKIADLFI